LRLENVLVYSGRPEARKIPYCIKPLRTRMWTGSGRVRVTHAHVMYGIGGVRLADRAWLATDGCD